MKGSRKPSGSRGSEPGDAGGQCRPARPEDLRVTEIGLSLRVLAVVPRRPFLREPNREAHLGPDRDAAGGAGSGLRKYRPHILGSIQ
jgi:hypothetical protein